MFQQNDKVRYLHWPERWGTCTGATRERSGRTYYQVRVMVEGWGAPIENEISQHVKENGVCFWVPEDQLVLKATGQG